LPDRFADRPDFAVTIRIFSANHLERMRRMPDWCPWPPAKISVELARSELGRSKRKAHLGLAVVVTNVSSPNADLDASRSWARSKINLGAVVPIFGSMSPK
jgi:hypothetical protein